MDSALEPRRHDPPPGWDAETFEAVTDAIAAALIASLESACSCPVGHPTDQNKAAFDELAAAERTREGAGA